MQITEVSSSLHHLHYATTSSASHRPSACRCLLPWPKVIGNNRRRVVVELKMAPETRGRIFASKRGGPLYVPEVAAPPAWPERSATTRRLSFRSIVLRCLVGVVSRSVFADKKAISFCELYVESVQPGTQPIALHSKASLRDLARLTTHALRLPVVANCDCVLSRTKTPVDSLTFQEQ